MPDGDGPGGGTHSLQLLQVALGVQEPFTEQPQACIPQWVVTEVKLTQSGQGAQHAGQDSAAGLCQATVLEAGAGGQMSAGPHKPGCGPHCKRSHPSVYRKAGTEPPHAHTLCLQKPYSRAFLAEGPHLRLPPTRQGCPGTPGGCEEAGPVAQEGGRTAGGQTLTRGPQPPGPLAEACPPTRLPRSPHFLGHTRGLDLSSAWGKHLGWHHPALT